jgi:hypothetical protein
VDEHANWPDYAKKCKEDKALSGQAGRGIF